MGEEPSPVKRSKWGENAVFYAQVATISGEREEPSHPKFYLRLKSVAPCARVAMGKNQVKDIKCISKSPNHMCARHVMNEC